MRIVNLVGKALLGFMVTYLSIFAALIVLPSFLGVLVNLYAGDFQNAGTLFSVLVCAAVLSSNFIMKHLRSLNIIPVK
ncbi:hypothetical protein H1D32_11775 [Anaerobacillus sp. CMMVII]|uniref:hypothetical protein n=1 Tax=Anaerobacillus sp. CMMVII TaxID=2755588 RepID=UPI0021B7A85C|nr:hypothetical protein [Anaerobacillus sp. CMMVII]MCT8138370.1 hypothetical protein [Anaerobacillus sp. CMMVII]